MFVIISHHYVVNSGIMGEITCDNVMNANSLFCLIFGWGGKTGINCFVLITGYYMCKSQISIKKILKLVMEIEFYKILFYVIFLLSGYSVFSIKEFIKVLLPIYGIGFDFVASYLLFYFFIPYLNILINAMNEKQHICLLGLCIGGGSLIQTLLKAPAAFTYIGWFMVVYMISSYIRLYPKEIFDNKKIWLIITCISLLLSWGSVIVGSWIYSKTDKKLFYHFVEDSNKILAIITAVSAFLLFKNIKMRYSPLINKVAASTFGVLMIHANSDTMRRWLWGDVFQNIKYFYSEYLILHAVMAVIVIYVVGTLIDVLRINLLEKRFFKWYDDKILSNRIERNN